MVFAACYWHLDSSDWGQEGCFSAHGLGLPNCYVFSFRAMGCWGVEVHHHTVPETWSAALVVELVTSTSDRGCKDSETHDHQRGSPAVVMVSRTWLGLEVLVERDHDRPRDVASRAGPKDKYEAQHLAESGRDECRAPEIDD